MATLKFKLVDKKTEDESFLTHFNAICKLPVPVTAKYRTRYIYIAEEYILGLLNGNKCTEIQEAKILNVFDNLLSYYVKNRMGLSTSHRKIIFLSMTKYNLAFYRIYQKKVGQKGFDISSKQKAISYNMFIRKEELLKHGIETEHIDFDKITQRKFWAFLCFITEKVNTIRHSEEFEILLLAIYNIFAEISIMEEKGTSIINHPMYREPFNDANSSGFRINRLFIAEVERRTYEIKVRMIAKSVPKTKAFKTIIDRIFVNNKFLKHRIEYVNSVNIKQLSARIDRIVKLIAGPIKQSAESELMKLICEANLIIGEREMFREKWPVDDFEAYGILCKFRTSFIDKLNVWINDKPIEKVVEEHIKVLKSNIPKGNKDNIINIDATYFPIDVNYDVTMGCIVDKFFKMKYSKYDLSKYIVSITKESLCEPYPSKYLYDIFNKVDGNGFKSTLIPFMLKCVDEWFCVDTKRSIVYSCYSFFQCVQMWMQLCISDTELEGVLPDGLDLNIIECLMDDKKVKTTSRTHDISDILKSANKEKGNSPEDDLTSTTSVSENESDWVDENDEESSSEFGSSSEYE
jgi:hypothetical protein